jgi:hypothetical protein
MKMKRIQVGKTIQLLCCNIQFPSLANAAVLENCVSMSRAKHMFWYHEYKSKVMAQRRFDVEFGGKPSTNTSLYIRLVAFVGRKVHSEWPIAELNVNEVQRVLFRAQKIPHDKLPNK